MRIFNRKSQAAGLERGDVTLRIAAVLAALLAAPAVLHALVPTSLVILQIFLDVCQFCVSILQLCGM